MFCKLILDDEKEKKITNLMALSEHTSFYYTRDISW